MHLLHKKEKLEANNQNYDSKTNKQNKKLLASKIRMIMYLLLSNKAIKHYL